MAAWNVYYFLSSGYVGPWKDPLEATFEKRGRLAKKHQTTHVQSDMYGISVRKPSKSFLSQSIISLTGMLVIISGVHVCGSLLYQMKLLPVSV